MTAIAPVITIDGPSGAGKGTLCKAMAEALPFPAPLGPLMVASLVNVSC